MFYDEELTFDGIELSLASELDHLGALNDLEILGFKPTIGSGGQSLSE